MKDDLFFEAAKPYRFLFLSSPLWLAAVLIGLEYLGGQQVRTVIHFMTGSHAR